MKYPRLEPINIIWTKTIFGLSFALALFLWGWIKPDWHFMFITQSVVFPIRMLLWVMSTMLCVNALIYAYQSFNAWFDRP